MSPLSSRLLAFMALVGSVCCQLCPDNALSSPPAIRHGASRPEDIEWKAVPGSPNTWQYELVFDRSEKQWNNINVKIITRLFNNHFPSQTLRFKRGNQYQIKVINNLGSEPPNNPTEMNVAKDLNTVNVC